MTAAGSVSNPDYEDGIPLSTAQGPDINEDYKELAASTGPPDVISNLPELIPVSADSFMPNKNGV